MNDNLTKHYYKPRDQLKNASSNYNMTKKDILEIALKILGIYLLTVALDSLILCVKSTTYFISPKAPDANKDLIYFVSNFLRTVIYTFGFWLLIFKTNLIIGKLIKDNPDTIYSFNVDKKDLIQLLFITSGIIITLASVSGIWGGFNARHMEIYVGIDEDIMSMITFTQLGIPITKGILGLTLIFASNYFAGVLARKKE